MKRDSLTFGAKINGAFAALAAVLAATVWLGFHTAGTLSESLESATAHTTRKLELIGAMNSGRANMAAGQRGAIMFAYAKESGQSASARQLFRESAESFRKALAEIGPLLVTEEGKQLVSRIEARFAQWLPAYSELEQLLDAGNLEGAAKVLLEKTKPHYVALGEDCTKLVAINHKLIDEER